MPSLTHIELCIAQLLAKNVGYKAIRRSVRCSVDSFRGHVHHMYRKTGTRTREELLCYCRENIDELQRNAINMQLRPDSASYVLRNYKSTAEPSEQITHNVIL